MWGTHISQGRSACYVNVKLSPNIMRNVPVKSRERQEKEVASLNRKGIREVCPQVGKWQLTS